MSIDLLYLDSGVRFCRAAPGRIALTLVSLAGSLGGGAALAAPPTVPAPVETVAVRPGQARTGALGFLNGLSRSNYLLGDLWGFRSLLSRHGMTLSLQETSELLGNVDGGIKKGFKYDGLTQAVLQLDTQRAFHWHGGTLNISGLQIHGSNLSAENLGTLQTASGIEADRATRLWEFWYQQRFLEDDRLDVKLGQQSLDQEFMASQNANLFVNTMFGWPMLPSADLPGGGPAYPLSALGIRFRARPGDAFTVLAGVFNGNPAAYPSDDSQRANPHGTSFPLHGGVLAIAELQFAYPSLGTMIQADQREPLGRTYKLGVWYDSERFADQRFDTLGRSLADPGSNGIPQTHRGDHGIYVVADQMLWRALGEPDQNINVFVRAMAAPQGDRNLIGFSMNAGFTFHEPFTHRDDDTFGIGMGYTRVASHARGLDQDTGAFAGSYTPVRGGETFVEAMYQYQVKPWWQLQPDVQYVFRPGAGAQDPNRPAQTIPNETVIGLRTNLLF
ncbi:MAG: carbohydrate porin [Holophaga sp.]|nr:carbohydrate porin [Holophaga sp.]